MSDTPQSGDVIVRRRIVRQSKLLYDVGILGQPTQYSVETYERALNRADSFARHAHLNVWYTDDGATFRSITRRRPAVATS